MNPAAATTRTHKSPKQAETPAQADQTTTTPDQNPTPTPAPAPVKKEKTPEQKASAMRREANELRRAAKTLGEDTDGGRSLIARATGLETDADAIAPRKTKSSESRPTCKGTKKDGSACTAHAMEGSEFCTDHRAVRTRFTDAQWAAFQAIPTETLISRLGWGVALKMADEQLKSQQ